MAENYYYMWETVTSVTILVLIIAYFIYDRLRIRYEALDDGEREHLMNKLNSNTQLVLGLLAIIGSGAWMFYMKTTKIYITPELEGFHNYTPAIAMGVIGLIVFILGLKNRFAAKDMIKKE